MIFTKMSNNNPTGYAPDSSSSEGMPRCAKCQVVISSSVRLKALGQDWHQECFVCNRCGKELKGGYYPHDSKPYCEDDYDDLFLKKCTACNRSIEGTYYDDRRGGYYHAACFICKECGASLENSFLWNDKDKIVCDSCGKKSQNSMQRGFNPGSSKSSYGNHKCAKCSNAFENGTKMLNMENGKKYHEHCFTCFICGTVIGVNTYTVAPYEEDRVCCMKCTEGKAEKCGKCGQVMLGTKITALGKKFHDQCFRCTRCQDQIPQNVDFFSNSIGEPVCKSCFE